MREEFEDTEKTVKEDYFKHGSTIDALVLHFLMGGQVRTLQEIADKIEISKRTAQRSLSRLSCIGFVIHSLPGGGGYLKGGVYLDRQHLYLGLTKESISHERKRQPAKNERNTLEENRGFFVPSK